MRLALLIAALPLSLVRADEPATLIVHNGKLLTVDAKFTQAEAVAVRDAKILAVGTNGGVLSPLYSGEGDPFADGPHVIGQSGGHGRRS